MPWASVGRAGSTGNASVGSSSMSVTLNGQAGTGANQGDLLVYSMALTSLSSSSVATAMVTTVTDTGSNIWTKVREQQSGSSVSQLGAICSLWYSNITNSLSTTAVVTATFGSTATNDAQAGIVFRFSKQGYTSLADSTFVMNKASTRLGPLDLAGDGTEYLRFRAIALASTITSISTTAGWTNIGTTRGAANTPPAIHGEYLVTTASTAASDPSNTLLKANASVLALFEENTLMGDGEL